ncbi:MAG: hypothetical protein GC201_01015 [Alphaproteobacteria bacterium]|nr:hypothetical protein [Alphaproteobacteria bacterium]
MGLLDGGIQSVFSAAFGQLYLDATLHRVTIQDDGTGSYTTVESDEVVRAQVEVATWAMRQADGYSDGDVRVLILAAGVDRPKTDDQITVRGVRWSLSNIGMDPAASYYDCRGRRA